MPFTTAANQSRFPPNHGGNIYPNTQTYSHSEAGHHTSLQYDNTGMGNGGQNTGEGARPSRVTLQPISETAKRVMSNPSRGARGQSQEPFEMAAHGGYDGHHPGGNQMMTMQPYEHNQQGYLNQ